MNPELDHFAGQLKRCINQSRQRALLLIQGDACWREQIRNAVSPDDALILQHKVGENSRQPSVALGRTLSGLICDLSRGVDIDRLAAAVGAVDGGGTIVLELDEVATAEGHFMRRLILQLNDSPHCLQLTQGEPLPTLNRSLPVSDDSDVCSTDVCRTADQATAVQAIEKLAAGRARRPLVLMADRGRGKSSAIGIAASRLIQQGKEKLFVTGPRKAVTDEIFLRAGTPTGLEFYAVDVLLQQPEEPDVLFVDEAAAIPTPVLLKILKRFRRIVFSTTVDGYEGNGQGFLLRFTRYLDELTPAWKKLQLDQPIRWQSGDPAEVFFNQAFLLSAGLAEVSPIGDIGKIQLRQVDVSELITNESLLMHLFGLLRLAHYRTSPADLRQILDQRDITLYGAFDQDNLTAVVMTVTEGGFEDSVFAEAVASGQRRLKGHLIPQSLALHAGLPAAMALRYERVVRIVVHPELQGRGVGSSLLHYVETQIKQQGCDCLGVSFGVDEGLFRFWRKAGFMPARMGLRINAMSGSRSLMMLKGISADGYSVVKSSRAVLARELPQLLPDYLQDLECEAVIALLDELSTVDPTTYSTENLQRFISAGRPYEVTLADIWTLVFCSLVNSEWVTKLTDPQKSLLVKRVLQKQSWEQVIADMQLEGIKPALKMLKEAVSVLYSVKNH